MENVTIRHKRILIFNWMEIDLTHHPSRYVNIDQSVCVCLCYCGCPLIISSPFLLLLPSGVGLSLLSTLPLEASFSLLISLLFHPLSFFSLLKTVRNLVAFLPVFLSFTADAGLCIYCKYDLYLTLSSCAYSTYEFHREIQENNFLKIKKGKVTLFCFEV